MTLPTNRFLKVNGLRLHITEQGKGPLILLCHGFPETSHAWRHQLPALAQAGYRAVAPDLRGYGTSDCPEAVEAYAMRELVDDLLGLLDALGEDQAVVIGGDWGAALAWQAARVHPDRFRAVAALGVPMMQRAPAKPSEIFPKTDQVWFYTHYFAIPGLAERELEIDVGMSLSKIYSAASGAAGRRDDPSTPNPFGMLPRSGGLLDVLPEPRGLPDWLPAEDMECFVKSFETSGFRGGLNYYRNLDRNWVNESTLEGRRVEVPALYLVGERDTGLAIPGMRELIEAMPVAVPDLRVSRTIPGAGHWLQQEAPGAVNAALLGFLASL